MFTVAHQPVIQANDKKLKKDKQPEEKTNSKNSPSEKNEVAEKKKPFASTIFQTKSSLNPSVSQALEGKGPLAPQQPIQNRTSQLNLQKIKFRVSNGAAITAALEKSEKQAPAAPKQTQVLTATINQNAKNINLINKANVSENIQTMQSKESSGSLSYPVFTTSSPFVTFSTLHAKNFLSTSNTNSKTNKNNLINPKEAKNGNSSAHKQASTQASSPTNMDCNSSLDKSVHSSAEGISNQLTRASTANSLKFGTGEASATCASTAARLHFKEKTINNYTSNFLINGNSKSNKIPNECCYARSEFAAESKTEDDNASLNGFMEQRVRCDLAAFEAKPQDRCEKRSSNNLLLSTNPNQSANSLESDNSDDNQQTTTICLNLASISSLGFGNPLNSFGQNSNITNSSNNNFLLSGTNETNSNFEPHIRKKLGKKIKELKVKHKRLSKEGSYNCGRWQPEEHQRFIEAIMKYGNEWKQVQKHVGTRSSTQARSHAQKFFVKIKKSNLFHFNIDLSKNSIKTLHEMANSLNTDDYFNAIKALNCVAFERKTGAPGSHGNGGISHSNAASSQALSQGQANSSVNANGQKRKGKKEETGSNFIDLNNFYFSDFNGNFSIINNNDDHLIINGLNCNESNNIFGSFDTKATKKQNSNFNFSNIKIITTDCEENKKSTFSNPNSSKESDSNFTNENNNCNNHNNNFIIINNNINNYNYNINYNNFNNFNYYKTEHTSKKRNRFSSFEGIFPYVEKETWFPSHKKSIDDNEILNNFCASIKYEEFIDEEDDLENIIFMTNSNSDSVLKDKEFLNKKRIKPEKDNLNSRSRTNDNENYMRNFVDKDVEDIFLKFLDVN